MPIYYLTTGKNIELTAFEVERETKQLYFVMNGRSVTGKGRGAYARRLDKGDPNVFTDWSAALANYRDELALTIARQEFRLSILRRQLADADTLQPPVTEQREAQ